MAGAFSVPCVLFAPVSGVGGRSQGHGQQPGILVRRPLDRFKYITCKGGALISHMNTMYHRNVTVALDYFKPSQTKNRELDIRLLVNEFPRRQAIENRGFLSPIVDAILTCTRQIIALLGNLNETSSISLEGREPEFNDGNYRALLLYRISGGERDLQLHAKSAKVNVTRQSSDTKNAHISAAGSLIKETSIRRTMLANFRAIIADYTTDRQNVERLAIVVRYVQ